MVKETDEYDRCEMRTVCVEGKSKIPAMETGYQRHSEVTRKDRWGHDKIIGWGMDAEETQ